MMRSMRVLLVLSFGLFFVSGLAAQSSNSYSPSSFTFLAAIGGSNPASQTLTISPLAITPNWTISVSTKSGGSWLSTSNSSGTGAGTSVISVTTAGLTAGNYTGEVLLTFVGTQDIEHIPVNFNVAPSQLSLAGNVGGSNPPAQTLQLSLAMAGSGATTTGWNAQASTTSGGNWLTVPASGSGPSGGTTALPVSV